MTIHNIYHSNNIKTINDFSLIAAPVSAEQKIVSVV